MYMVNIKLKEVDSEGLVLSGEMLNLVLDKCDVTFILTTSKWKGLSRKTRSLCWDGAHLSGCESGCPITGECWKKSKRMTFSSEGAKGSLQGSQLSTASCPLLFWRNVVFVFPAPEKCSLNVIGTVKLVVTWLTVFPATLGHHLNC